MLSSYYLDVRTGMDYSAEEYDAAAGRLANVLVELLSTGENIKLLTHDSERESCHSEIEVMLDEGSDGRELVAKIVVDITAPQPVKFDKAKWTRMLKVSAYEWKALKTSKRQVPNVPDSFFVETPA